MKQLKLLPVFEIYESYLKAAELDALLVSLPMTRMNAGPPKLGKFQCEVYGMENKRPFIINRIYSRLSKLVPEQKFNRIAVNCFREGDFIKPHLDPLERIGYTLIVSVGNWQGGDMIIGKDAKLSLGPGDVLKLRCNIEGQERPMHRMAPVTKGIKYSLALETLGSNVNKLQ